MFGRKKRDKTTEVQIAVDGFDYWYYRDFRWLLRGPRPNRKLRFIQQNTLLEQWDAETRSWKLTSLSRDDVQTGRQDGYTIIDVPVERVRRAGIEPNATGERYVAFD